ncbi:MAG: hypothetical protein AB9866_22515 [Syntrophobacteraceae bacterium]
MNPPNIESKVKTAHILFEKWGRSISADVLLAGMLRELVACSEASGVASLRTGVTGACRHCDEEEGGSCCGAGIENRYTPELLLLNLLLGVDLPDSRYSEKSCYFLGNRGCILSARDILCINYLCTRLQREIPRENLIDLQETNGREMETLFILHDKIRNFIQQKTNRGFDSPETTPDDKTRPLPPRLP